MIYSAKGGMVFTMTRTTVRAFREADLDGAVAAKEAVGWPERRVLTDFYGRRDDSRT